MRFNEMLKYLSLIFVMRLMLVLLYSVLPFLANSTGAPTNGNRRFGRCIGVLGRVKPRACPGKRNVPSVSLHGMGTL